VRGEGFAFQFRVELHADEPRVVLYLDDLGQTAIRGHARKDQAAFFQLRAVVHVHFIAVAVAFLDCGLAVNLRDL
jgi:hypothetical protein